MTPPTTYPTTDAISCVECLRSVATADVLELTTATAVAEHCRRCTDCAGVIDEVAREERRLADALDGTTPGVPASVVALRAVAGAARGRRRTRRLRIALGAVATVVAPLGAVLLLRGQTDGAVATETRNVELQCLAPVHAAVLVPPALPREVLRGISLHVSPHDLPIIAVSGSARDLATVERVIARIDARWAAERSEYCVVPGRAGRPVPTTIITAPARPHLGPR
jgi:hypothetical protein